MLKNTFFTIKTLTSEGNSFIAEVFINPEHAVFAGHFPQQAVVPGVFSLQMVKECTEQVLDKSLRYAELANCKFSNVIIPDAAALLRVEGNHTLQTDGIMLKAAVVGDSISYLSLKALMQPA